MSFLDKTKNLLSGEPPAERANLANLPPSAPSKLAILAACRREGPKTHFFEAPSAPESGPPEDPGKPTAELSAETRARLFSLVRKLVDACERWYEDDEDALDLMDEDDLEKAVVEYLGLLYREHRTAPSACPDRPPRGL